MTHRFSFDEPSAADRLLAAATELNINFVDVGGYLHVTYQLTTKFGNRSAEPEGSTASSITAAAVGFASDLLAEFQQAKGGGA